jgi:tryptophan synthase alpha chain
VPDLASQLDTLLEKTDIYRTYILQHPFDEKYFMSIKNKARGFVLLQSFADAAGKREKVAPENKIIIERMRNTGLNAVIILGYGINNPERVKEAVEVGADGVIVGTAMIERINQADYGGLSEFIRALKTATLPEK